MHAPCVAKGSYFHTASRRNKRRWPIKGRREHGVLLACSGESGRLPAPPALLSTENMLIALFKQGRDKIIARQLQSNRTNENKAQVAMHRGRQSAFRLRFSFLLGEGEAINAHPPVSWHPAQSHLQNIRANRRSGARGQNSSPRKQIAVGTQRVNEACAWLGVGGRPPETLASSGSSTHKPVGSDLPSKQTGCFSGPPTLPTGVGEWVE